MFALSMQYASGYLELFSSYFRIAKENNSISWSICLRTEEGPDTCYSREGRWWTDIGRRRENPSWWVGENCVNWMLIIIFWRTHTPIEVAKKVIQASPLSLMQENNKDFPFSPKWVWDFQYIGHGANKLASPGKGEPLYFWPRYRSGSLEKFAFEKRHQEYLISIEETSCLKLHCFTFYWLPLSRVST